jgi:hypothetical protein
MKVKTLEQARRFVIKQRICTVFAGSSKTLNIARSNEPGMDRDAWLPFQEIYLEVYRKYDAEL